MYITGKYWENYVGDTDDSLTLVEYLAEKQKTEIPLEEIFSDFGLEKLQGNFRNPDVALVYTDPEGWETPIYFAIDLIMDLAALLLECKINRIIELCELSEADPDTMAVSEIRITATPEEYLLIGQVLADFTSDPLAYDLSEMCTEEEMRETAAVCEALRKELYERTREQNT